MKLKRSVKFIIPAVVIVLILVAMVVHASQRKSRRTAPMPPEILPEI